MNQIRKDILLVTRPMCPPWDEASKNFAYNLANRIPAHNFHLLTYKKLPHSQDNFREHPIYSSASLRMSLGQKLRLLLFFFAIPKEIDIIHFLFTPSRVTGGLLKNLLLPAAEFQAKKKLHTLQTAATLDFERLTAKNIKQILFSEKIITHSRYSEKFLEGFGLKNVSQIYPGIDLEKFKKRKKDITLLEKLGIKSEEKVLLYTGEYTRLQAIDLIIKSLPKVKEKFFDFKIILACRIKSHADLTKKKEVKKRLAEMGLLSSVVFLETFSPMTKLYSLADVFLFPVKTMRGKFDIALTVAEALASGIPSIISDLDPIKEAAAYPDSALFLRERTPEELSYLILQILQNKDLAFKLEKSAQLGARERFNLDDCAKEYEAVYNSF
jgi:glycosyltransferase involved in cell wall biosynthesis